MWRSNQRTWGLILALVSASMTLTGCSATQPLSSPAPTGFSSDVSRWATAAGACNEDAALIVNISAPAPTELVTQDVCIGSGEPITTQKTITANFVIKTLRTGEVLTSTWSTGGPLEKLLSNTIDGWKQGIVGMRVHGRRIVVIPAPLAYGDNPPAGTPIRPGDSFVLLIQIESAR